ncbi:MAG: hypothetical protein IPK50_09385 [Fibrobacterota bacterium]|nr:MAG: hypothetical protein IPK50_09385 [Fibrobacterota bacterium]
MRKSILGLLALPLFLAGCDLSETLNIFKLGFSSNGYDGPTINGPSLARVGVMLLPKGTSIGTFKIEGGDGLTPTQILDSFKLGITFKVKADNSGNSEKAAFGTDLVKPKLQFHLMDKSSTPIDVEFKPFSVDGGKVMDLTFPVELPVSMITSPDMRKKLLRGDAVPYFLSGVLSFDLKGLDGASKGLDNVTVELATDSIPTRPKDGSAAELGSALVDLLF